MPVTEDGITVFLHPTTKEFDDEWMMALQLSRESKYRFSAATVMEERSSVAPKALSSIFVTDAGSVNLARLRQ